MKEFVGNGLLYDFYGELLTPHQRKVYEAAVYEDMSLNEIAEQHGISRQGVHDLLKRCTKTMQGYEDRLHMVSRYSAIDSEVKGFLHLLEEADMDAALKKKLMKSAGRIGKALA